MTIIILLSFSVDCLCFLGGLLPVTSTLGRPQLQCLHFEDSLTGVFCFIAFVKMWDCSISGRELLNFKGHNQDVFTCMFSPDDSNVVSCSADKTVKVLLQ